MGSFNHTGNFSHIPITYKDRIVVILGLRAAHTDSNYDVFAPGVSFMPISLPIRGTYDDYGGIENVEENAAIYKVEEFFDGESIENIVKYAERISSGNEAQEVYPVVMSAINKVKSQNFSLEKEEFYLDYIMEHENIFDSIVKKGNPLLKDKYFWRIPHFLLESIGYIKDSVEEYSDYDITIWKHGTLPLLKEKCYLWLEDEFGDYSKTCHTFTDLCAKIGYDINNTVNFNQTYLDYCFSRDIKVKEFDLNISNDYDTFIANRYTDYSVFKYHTEYDLQLIEMVFNVSNDEHIDNKYRKEFVDFIGLLWGMVKLELSWGTTNYCGQEVSYDDMIDFHKTVMNTLINKKPKYEENK